MDTPACTQARQHLDTARGEVSQAHQDMNRAHSRRHNAQQAVDAASSRSQAAYERKTSAESGWTLTIETIPIPGRTGPDWWWR